MEATWLAFTSTVLALARFAIMRSWSGLIDRSALATMYQVGFDFQAGLVPLWWNELASVGRDRHLRYSHEVRLGGGNIRCEVGREMRVVYPPVPVAIRLECLGRLRQGLFDRRTAVTFIECKRGDVDQCRNVWIITGLADDGPAVAMADQYDRPAHGVDGGPRVLFVVGIGGFGGLRYRHRVAILLEDLGDG